ncbi:hypothetical protein TOC8171_01780 [Pseudomonas syringae]
MNGLLESGGKTASLTDAGPVNELAHADAVIALMCRNRKIDSLKQNPDTN